MTTTNPRMIVIMGVCGSGKTTIGEALSKCTSIPFHDGDDFHSAANREKMSGGVPLTDDDREPWLQAIVDFAEKEAALGRSVLIACSALRKKYRDQLRTLGAPVYFVHLSGSKEVIAKRLAARKGHYMPESLLQSQLDTLESPAGEAGVVEVTVDQTAEEMVEQIVDQLKLT